MPMLSRAKGNPILAGRGVPTAAEPAHAGRPCSDTPSDQRYSSLGVDRMVTLSKTAVPEVLSADVTPKPM